MHGFKTLHARLAAMETHWVFYVTWGKKKWEASNCGCETGNRRGWERQRNGHCVRETGILRPIWTPDPIREEEQWLESGTLDSDRR